VTNALFFGFIFSNPFSAITLAIFVAYIIPVLDKVNKKENLYFILLPSVFFLFRWIMPWYFFWLVPMAMVIDDKEDMKRYIKVIGLIAILYGLGIVLNIDYYMTSNLLIDLAEHFNFKNI
jgi:hypothetical protein